MKRQLFTFCSAASLLLCAAVCVLWVLSFRRVVRVLRVGSGGAASCFVFHGCVKLHRQSGPIAITNLYQQGHSPGDWIWEYEPINFPNRLGWRGVLLPQVFVDSGGSGGIVNRILFVPLWIPAVLAAWLPARSLLRRWRSVPHGHCPACGYDLRATPERCPECGAAADQRGGAAAAPTGG
jgi:hypothetical protein